MPHTRRMRQLLRYAGYDQNLISSRFSDAMDFNAKLGGLYARQHANRTAALFLNRNLALFARFDPMSVVNGKSRRALRTAVGLNY